MKTCTQCGYQGRMFGNQCSDECFLDHAIEQRKYPQRSVMEDWLDMLEREYPDKYRKLEKSLKENR